MLSTVKGATALSIIVMLVAFVFRVDYRLSSVDEIALRADAGQYFQIAHNVVEHATFSTSYSPDAAPSPDSYRGPLYPLLIAAFLASAGDGDPIAIAYHRLLFFQAAFGALTAALVFLLGRLWLPTGAALVAAALSATWPLLITLSALALTEVLFGGLMVVAIGLQAIWIRTDAWTPLIAAALAWAACILLNPVAMPAPLLLGLVSWGQGKLRIFAFIGIALAPQAMWSVRNASVVEASGVSSSSLRLLENVLIGMEPDFNHYYQRRGDPSGVAARNRVSQGTAAYVRGEGTVAEIAWNRFRQDPGGIALHSLQKPLDFWKWEVEQGYGGPYVYRMVRSPFDSSSLYAALLEVTRRINFSLLLLAAVPIVALVASSTWRRWAWERRTPLLVLVLVLYATAVHTVLTPDARYAAPFRSFQFLCAAWGGWILYDLFRSRVLTRSHGAIGTVGRRSAQGRLDKREP